jgi:hypothetical protein
VAERRHVDHGKPAVPERQIKIATDVLEARKSIDEGIATPASTCETGACVDQHIPFIVGTTMCERLHGPTEGQAINRAAITVPDGDDSTHGNVTWPATASARRGM